MIYRFVWVLFYLPFHLAYRLRFIGRDRLPSGAYILSGNHVSYLDPVLLAFSSYRSISYMAKVELFETARWFGWILRRLNAFPVDRGSADRAAIAEATARLTAGRIVGIFPEGTRTSADTGAGEVGQAYGGAAMVALRTGVPIVPVGIHGTGDALPRDGSRIRFVPVRIVFGDPIRPEDAPEGSRRERVDALTAMLMERIAQAVSEAAGGV